MAGRNMELKQVAEYNITRLGLIPAQSKLPSKYRMGWEEVRGESDNIDSVRATTGEACGVPHGLAGDVMAALMTLAVANADKKVDGKVRTTLEELSKMMLIKTIKGQNYKDIISALDSLSATAYTVEQRWRTPIHKKRTFVRFLLVNKFGIEETIPISGGVSRNIFAIDLNELLWQSAAGGLTLALDPELLAAVDSPTTRAIYRMLENFRRSENDPEHVGSELTMRATEFADAARLLSSGTALSDRFTSLTRKNGAFEQLKREGYLQSIDMTGRGDNTIIQFRFADQRNIIHTRAEQLLTEHGVQPSYALKLAQQFTGEEVECAIWLTEQASKKQRGTPSEIKNPSGLIIKLLTSGDAQARKEDFKQAIQSSRGVRERISPPQSEPTAIPEKTTEEQLKTVLSVKKISASTSNALKKAVEEKQLTTDQIKSLIFASDPEKSALELLSLPTE